MTHLPQVTSILAVAVLCAAVSPASGVEPAPAAQAPPEGSAQTPEGTEPLSATEAPRSAVEEMERLRDLWLAEAHLALGAAADGSWIGFGSAVLAVPPGPGWGAARISAFQRAEAEARASFVERIGVSTSAETFSRLAATDGAFEGLLDPERELRGDRLAGIQRRLAALEGDERKQVLELLGLDPKDLAALGEGEQRKALEESFQSRVATRAMGQLRGLRVLQTFEGHSGDDFAVGVLVRWSEEQVQLAKILRTGRGTLAGAKEGLPLEKWIPTDEKLLIHDWGVRVFPGPEREPLIVVFSQAPVELGPEDNARVREAKRRFALARAKAFALRDLTWFVNATTAVDQVTLQGERFEHPPAQPPDGVADLEPGSSEIEAMIERTIETRGAAVISGGTVVKSWTAPHPVTGALFSGVVFAWSPTRARLALDPAGAKGSSSTGTEDNDYPVDF